MSLVEQAIHDTVHDERVNAKQLASKIGMGHQTLLNKANIQNETHKLSIVESTALQIAANDFRIQHAYNTELESFKQFSNDEEDIVYKILKTTILNADVIKEVTNAIADGVITNREAVSCLEKVEKHIEALNNLSLKIKNNLGAL